MIDRLHLKPKHREVLEAFLQKCLPGVEVWAYGSRINGRSHNGSDLDLVLRGPGLKEIPAGRLADFEEGLHESLIPFLVEARDWARLPERFHRQIEHEHVVLVSGERMPGDWREVTIGEIADVVGGSTPSTKAPDNFDEHIPWLTPKDLSGPHNRYVERGERNLSRKGLKSCSAKLLPTGSVLLSTRAPIGYVALAKNPIATNQGFRSLVCKEEASAEYIYYWLIQNTEELKRHASGSTFQELSGTSLKNLHLRLPSLPEQRAITHVLGTLDDKIELNRRMNETLEAMARAIFKNWFVDFGPVRAKMKSRGPYLPPEIWGLFPDALDDDKPVGWNRGILADVAESPRRGIRPADVSEDTPYIGLEHMPRRSIALSEWEGAGKVKSNKTQFHRGEILFGKLRPYFHKVGIAPLDGICSTDIVVAVPRAQEWGAFTLACLSSDEFVDYTDRTSTGTKMPRTSWKTMAQYKLCLPPRRIVWAFQSIVRPLFDRLGANICEASALTQTRDLLLPKLMSGDIRLCDAEKAVEVVA